MKFCSKCGKEIIDEAVGCPDCELEIKNNDNNKTEKISHIFIAVSIVMILIAIVLVISYQFHFYVYHIGYYKQQYEECLFDGYSYSVTSAWKELYYEALIYIILHIVGSTILFVGGEIGLYIGLRKLKKANVSTKDN